MFLRCFPEAALALTTLVELHTDVVCVGESAVQTPSLKLLFLLFIGTTLASSSCWGPCIHATWTGKVGPEVKQNFN